MKKNFVKKLALGLALVMAVTSVPASSEAAAAPGFKSSAVKVRVGQTKKYGTENSSKYSVKFVIGNKDVATIKYSAGSKSVKVTGVAEGETKLRAEFKSYKTKEVTKVRIPVTVLAAKEEAPVVTVTELASVKQTAANVFEATFTGDASKTITAENFTTIETADGVFSAYVKSVEFSADGKTAKVTTFGNFVDGAVYNVTCADKTASFTASVGKVATAVITTVQAQANVATDVEFKLYDAKGIDVTNAVDVDTYVSLDVDGDYSDENVAEASNATITLDTVGATATVTLTYDAVDGSEPVVAKGTIVCISTQATVGAKTMFTTNSFMASYYAEDNMPKPYLNTFAPATTLYDENQDATFYFAAFDKDGLAIEYDEFEVESSNENVISAAVNKDSGKYATIDVSTESVGTAKVIIRATKNEVETVYSGTIVVKAERELTSVVLDKTSLTIGNNDANKNDCVKVTLKDQYGNKYSAATYEVEVNNDEDADKLALEKRVDAADDHYVDVAVAGADQEADSYVVKVVAADDENEITKKFTVKVREVKDTVKASYKVELSKNSVDLNPAFDAMPTVEADLAVYRGTVFSHYYGAEEGENADSVNVEIKKGSDVVPTSGSSITINTVELIDGKVHLSDELSLTETGSWTVSMKFADVINEAEDLLTKKATYTVKNTMEMPSVTVDARTGEESGLDLLKECITVDVAVLGDEDDVIIGMYDKDFNDVTVNREDDPETAKDESYTYDSNEFSVKYVAIADNFKGVDYVYYVPVGKKFETK